MLELLRLYQSEIMYVLSGVCGMIALFACNTKYLPKLRKNALLVIALSVMVLLISENLSEVYYGVTTQTAYWMVRICNFLDFFLTLLVIHGFALYLIDVFRTDLQLRVPKRLWSAFFLICAGEILIIISQFTGLFYSFDAVNEYHRSSMFAVSYIAPLLSVLLLLSVILQYRGRMRTKTMIMLVLFTVVPLTAAIIQLNLYGIYLTEMTLVGMVVLLFMITLKDTNRQLDQARERELQLLKEEQEHTQKLFSQITVALAGAIDAKDAYTQGHSSRVAEYARKIAAASGKSERECDDIYYAALLHDVGKIGTPDTIIKKKGELTAEEYEKIKDHPSIGTRILSEISDFPYLRAAAQYHHENYDGTGYPNGLKGEEIPELARIVAVADAYDAMTSNRSYRDQLAQEEAREELIRCSGTQFDPEIVQIMLRIIDQDKEFSLREN